MIFSGDRISGVKSVTSHPYFWFSSPYKNFQKIYGENDSIGENNWHKRVVYTHVTDLTIEIVWGWMEQGASWGWTNDL
jgi:hypothetical protein